MPAPATDGRTGAGQQTFPRLCQPGRCARNPDAVALRWQNDDHVFFIGRLVEPVHQGMGLRIEGEHGVAVDQLARGALSARPQARNSQWCLVCCFNAGGDGFTATPSGLKNGVSRNDAALVALVGVPETGLDGGGFAAAVVGAARDFGVGSPVRHQTEPAVAGFSFWHRVVTDVGLRVPAHEGAQVTWPDIQSGMVGRWQGLCY